MEIVDEAYFRYIYKDKWENRYDIFGGVNSYVHSENGYSEIMRLFELNIEEVINAKDLNLLTEESKIVICKFIKIATEREEQFKEITNLPLEI